MAETDFNAVEITPEQQFQQGGDANAAAQQGGEVAAVEEEQYQNETMDAPFGHFRYYVGHTTKFGNEFLEFELRNDGVLRYANNSHYRNDNTVKKQVKCSQAIVDLVKKMTIESNIFLCDDAKWPEPDRDGKQELDVQIGGTHVSFATNKIGQLKLIEQSADPQGLGAFFFLVNEVKDLVFALLSMHFKINPVAN